LDIISSVDVVARGEIRAFREYDTVLLPFDIQFIDCFLTTLLQRMCMKPEEGGIQGKRKHRSACAVPWMELAQDRDRWRALVSTVKFNLRVP
jgi:hypothetical protein